jgi:3-oxoacyl-[acyl-carrier protein] reductase
MPDRASDQRIVVVTGVSRRAGIGFAIAQRLLHEGAKVLLHSFSLHAGQSWVLIPVEWTPSSASLAVRGGAFNALKRTSATPMLRGG